MNYRNAVNVSPLRNPVVSKATKALLPSTAKGEREAEISLDSPEAIDAMIREVLSRDSVGYDAETKTLWGLTCGARRIEVSPVSVARGEGVNRLVNRCYNDPQFKGCGWFPSALEGQYYFQEARQVMQGECPDTLRLMDWDKPIQESSFGSWLLGQCPQPIRDFSRVANHPALSDGW